MDLLLLVCCIILSFSEISRLDGQARGWALAAVIQSSPTPPVHVVIQGTVKTGKDTALQCHIDQTTSAHLHIETVTWKRKQDRNYGQSAPGSNTTSSVPEKNYLVLSTWAWSSNETNFPQYVIQEVSLEDEGVYCCEILTEGSQEPATGCVNVAASVLPTLSLKGTSCDNTKNAFCKSSAHIGKNLTCMANHYRPLVKLKLKWRVDSLTVPMYPSHTVYKNYTDDDGYLYYDAFSTVKFTKAGTHRYTCTATEIDQCGEGGCTVTDIVMVSRPNHLQLWWLIVPCLGIFTILFIIKWRAHSSKPDNTMYEHPAHVYRPVTDKVVETKKVDPEMEKFNINI